MTTEHAAAPGGEAPGPLAAALDAARAAGVHIVRLDLHGVTDKADFMDRCARALALPDWFGRNWDALADCLTDPGLAPDGPGRVLVVQGWQSYARARPREWSIAQDVFATAAEPGRGTHTAVLLAL